MTPKEMLLEIFQGMRNNMGFIKEFKEIENSLTELEELKSKSKKEHALLELYQKQSECVTKAPIIPDSTILHCVIRPKDEERYLRLEKQIKTLREEIEVKNSESNSNE